MEKHWIICRKKSDNLIDQLLINRGIKGKEGFLNPDYERDLHDPFLFKDMKKAVQRILGALERKEVIGIFADYDADGIPGAALLYKVFKLLGCLVKTYIPTREEGYGLNEKGVRELSENGCKLLITVDLGITGKKEVKLAKSLGMEVIITDHHEVQEKNLPQESLAILHPHLSSRYPNKDLAGGAVAWKLAQGLISKIQNPKSKIQNYLKWLLDLVGISTICDMVPLIGENRTLAKYGLIVLQKSKNLGLQKLYQAAGIKPENINPYIVGWQIGPRINAPGRIKEASLAYRLLISEKADEADKIVQQLNRLNNERQNKLEEVVKEAENKIKRRGLLKEKILLVEDKDWPHGIIGLVASKLVERYHRPAIVFTAEGEEWRGSARSITCFDIMKALEKVKKYLVGFGGHKAAAGLTVEKEKYPFLARALSRYARQKISDEDLLGEIKIDAEIDTRQIDARLYNQIKKFEPFGLGNPRPVFLTRRLAINEMRVVGKENRHLKLKLITNNHLPITKFEAIAFNCAKNFTELKIGDRIDVVFNLEENIWNNNRNLQLNILDIKKSVL